MSLMFQVTDANGFIRYECLCRKEKMADELNRLLLKYFNCSVTVRWRD